MLVFWNKNPQVTFNAVGRDVQGKPEQRGDPAAKGTANISSSHFLYRAAAG